MSNQNQIIQQLLEFICQQECRLRVIEEILVDYKVVSEMQMAKRLEAVTQENELLARVEVIRLQIAETFSNVPNVPTQ